MEKTAPLLIYRNNDWQKVTLTGSFDGKCVAVKGAVDEEGKRVNLGQWKMIAARAVLTSLAFPGEY